MTSIRQPTARSCSSAALNMLLIDRGFLKLDDEPDKRPLNFLRRCSLQQPREHGSAILKRDGPLPDVGRRSARGRVIHCKHPKPFHGTQLDIRVTRGFFLSSRSGPRPPESTCARSFLASLRQGASLKRADPARCCAALSSLLRAAPSRGFGNACAHHRDLDGLRPLPTRACAVP